jgi:hypothetical protein
VKKPQACHYFIYFSILYPLSWRVCGGSPGTGETVAPPPRGRFKIADAELQINELQDLAEVAPELLNLAAGQTPLRFFVQIRLGDGQTAPLPELIEKIDAVLAQVKDDWRVAG